MKITKKANLALLVMLTAVSILPGCGKSKNNEQMGMIGGPVGVPGGIVLPGGTNGCFQIAAAGDRSITFPITGQAQIGLTNIVYSAAPVGGSGGYVGNVYHKQNYSQDYVDISVPQVQNTTATISGVAHLSTTTTDALGGANNFCVQGIEFIQVGLGNGVLIPGSIRVYTSRGVVSI